jgi:Fe-S cluster assembly ATP-binding protein|tara:strand:- start:378 stop:1127 length:750 start_codon:yes stop_codon:yes gene_type:complete
MNTTLEIKHLEASIEDKKIIQDFNLSINPGEVHVIMGPNGSGKSTLSKILAGHPSYQVTGGEIVFDEKDLLDLSPEQRSHEGLFLAFQHPIEISGVTNYDFLRIAYNEKQKYLKKPELDPLEFMTLTQTFLTKLKMRNEFLNRNLNEGFSGGEKKRNEILQMLLLNPKLVILDEIDSGLDIDALKIICDIINENLNKNSSLIVITHYPKILQYLKPTFVHIMIQGKIVKTGGVELIEQLEKEGYSEFIN